jgi:hypothetical protein
MQEFSFTSFEKIAVVVANMRAWRCCQQQM